MLNLFSGNQTTELVSLLSREECRNRLQAQMDAPRTPEGTKPIIGYCDERSFHVWKRVKGRHSFLTHLYGRFNENYGQTNITCKFSIAPITKFVLAFQLLLSTFILAVIILPFPDFATAHKLSNLIPVTIIFGFNALRWVDGFKREPDGRPFIINFVCKTILATPVNSSAE